MKSHIRRTSWILLGQLSSFIAATAFLALASRTLTSEQLGALTVSLTVSLFQNQAIFAGLNAATNRFFAEYGSNSSSQFVQDLTSGVAEQARRTLPMVAVAAVGCSVFTGVDLGTLASALAFGYVQGALAIANSASNISGQVGLYGKTILAEATLRVSFSALPLLTDIGTPSYFLASLFASSLIALRYNLSQNSLLSRRDFSSTPAIPQKYKLEGMKAYAKPYFAAGVATWIYTSADRWLLSRFDSLNATGEYALLFQFGYSPSALLMAALATHMTPKVYSLASSGNAVSELHAEWLLLRACLVWIAAIIPVAGAASFFSVEAMELLAGKKLQDAQLLPQFILAGALASLIQPTSMLLNNRMRTDVLAATKILSSCAGVGLMYLSVTRGYGLNGVLLSLAASSALFVLCTLVANQSLRRRPQQRS